MAVDQSIADREQAAAVRAIQLGYVALKFLGNDDVPHVPALAAQRFDVGSNCGTHRVRA